MLPRLPRGVAKCEHEEACFWRRVALAALEQVAGAPAGDGGLPALVRDLRAEFARLRRQVDLDSKALLVLRSGEADLDSELASTRKQLRQAEEDNRLLRRENDSLMETAAQLRQELRGAAEEHEQLEEELRLAREHGERLERDMEQIEGKLNMANLRHETSEQSRAFDQKLLYLERKENTRIRQEALEVAMMVAAKRKTRAKGSARRSPRRSPGPQPRLK